MFTYDEAAAALGCSTKTVRRLVRRKELPVVRISARVHRIRTYEVEWFIQRRTKV